MSKKVENEVIEEIIDLDEEEMEEEAEETECEETESKPAGKGKKILVGAVAAFVGFKVLKKVFSKAKKNDDDVTEDSEDVEETE